LRDAVIRFSFQQPGTQERWLAAIFNDSWISIQSLHLKKVKLAPLPENLSHVSQFADEGIK